MNDSELLETLRNMVFDVFTQGKRQYIESTDQEIAANFINMKGVSVRSESLDAENVKIGRIRGPQKKMKAMAIKLLKERGFRVLSIERGFEGGVVDVLGGRGRERLAVECGPCRISKLIDYLWRDKTTLWIIKPDGKEYILYEFSRGENWDKAKKFYNHWSMSELEKARVLVNKAFKDFEK